MEFHTPTRSYQYAYSSSFILKDYGGAIIKGSCDVRDREGSIEVLSFTHGLHIPVDGIPESKQERAYMVHSPLAKSSRVRRPTCRRQFTRDSY